MNNDIINGSFEVASALFSLINIFKLVKDKEIRGVSWLPVAFFNVWGIWNLYYYPSLNQMFSFVGGIAIFSANAVWLALVFYYHKTRKNK